MAVSTIDSEKIILLDNWPAANIRRATKTGGAVDSAGEHNTEAALYRLGEKLMLYNTGTGLEGWSTFIYLRAELTGAPTSAAKQLVVPDAVGTAPYVVTNDPDSCIMHTGAGLAAVLLGLMTDAYYGWFWCGGVCPESFVAGLGGNYATDTTVVAGAFVAHNLDPTDAIGLGIVADDMEAIIGFALAADAA